MNRSDIVKMVFLAGREARLGSGAVAPTALIAQADIHLMPSKAVARSGDQLSILPAA